MCRVLNLRDIVGIGHSAGALAVMLAAVLDEESSMVDLCHLVIRAFFQGIFRSIVVFDPVVRHIEFYDSREIISPVKLRFFLSSRQRYLFFKYFLSNN